MGHRRSLGRALVRCALLSVAAAVAAVVPGAVPRLLRHLHQMDPITRYEMSSLCFRTATWVDVYSTHSHRGT